MFESIRIKCPFCLQSQQYLVDPDGGETQQLVEDCEVCCHPMDIQIVWDDAKKKFRATVGRSSGF